MAARVVRKHILLSEDEARRLDELARAAGCSQAAILRAALAAYAPTTPDAPPEDVEALLALVTSQVKEAVAETRRVRERIERLADALGGGERAA